MDNRVHLVGTVGSSFKLSHRTGNEDFYAFNLDVERDSGRLDHLTVIVSEKVIEGLKFEVGSKVSIEGQCRVFRAKVDDSTKRNELYTFATEVKECSKDDKDTNDVEIIGELVKCYECRSTRFTERELIEFKIKVSRNYGKCDWINCVAWGRDARYIDRIVKSIGIDEIAKREKFKIKGRLQSRTYLKRLSDEDCREIQTFELSVGDIEAVPKIKLVDAEEQIECGIEVDDEQSTDNVEQEVME